MIEAGTVQKGLKFTSVILEFMTGDWRSILPTPAAWRVWTTPLLDRLDEGGGDVHDHVALTEIAGIGAQANDVELELARRISAGTFMAAIVGPFSAPVAFRPCRAWNRRTPAST